MEKLDIKQVLARNLRAALKAHPTINSQIELASGSGVSPASINEAFHGQTSIGIELLNDMAYALGMQAWELLAETEEVKREALARMMWTGGVSDREVEKHLPRAPKIEPKVAPKEVARKRKKPRRSDEGPRGEA